MLVSAAPVAALADGSAVTVEVVTTEVVAVATVDRTVERDAGRVVGTAVATVVATSSRMVVPVIAGTVTIGSSSSTVVTDSWAWDADTKPLTMASELTATKRRAKNRLTKRIWYKQVPERELPIPTSLARASQCVDWPTTQVV